MMLVWKFLDELADHPWLVDACCRIVFGWNSTEPELKSQTQRVLGGTRRRQQEQL